MAQICSHCGQEIKNILREITLELVLDSTDGKETLANANGTFSVIDSDFKKWGLNKKGPATDTQLVDVYEMAIDATFKQMFDSLSNNLDRLCLTQAQIKQFANKHRKELRTDGYGTFFLFKGGSQFFVAYMGMHSGDALLVYVFRFENSGVWHAKDRHRVVVPQLAV